MISCFLTPVDLAFENIRTEYYGFAVMMQTIDVLFSLQIILNFITAVEDEN